MDISCCLNLKRYILYNSFLFVNNFSVSFNSGKEARESEERKPNSARPFLRHRFLSKDEDAQKIPGLYQNDVFEKFAIKIFVLHFTT